MHKMENTLKEVIKDTKTTMVTDYSKECESTKVYCKENIIDINNNITDFKDAMKKSEGKFDNEIIGCKKDLENTCIDIQNTTDQKLRAMDKKVEVRFI